jgi:hypothetical protein
MAVGSWRRRIRIVFIMMLTKSACSIHRQLPAANRQRTGQAREFLALDAVIQAILDHAPKADFQRL